MTFFTGSALASAFTGNPLPLMLANAGKDFNAVLAWLARDGWRIVSLILAILLAYQTVTKAAEQRREHKLETQLQKSESARKSLQSTLDQLRAQSKQQQRTVTKTIDHYITVTKPVVRTQVEKIEAAPLPGGCKDPQDILDADV